MNIDVIKWLCVVIIEAKNMKKLSKIKKVHNLFNNSALKVCFKN